MYAIIATDGDIINPVRKNIIDALAPSMGENVTEDMQMMEDVVDDVNDNEGCHVYLGFGISPQLRQGGVCPQRPRVRSARRQHHSWLLSHELLPRGAYSQPRPARRGSLFVRP